MTSSSFLLFVCLDENNNIPYYIRLTAFAQGCVVNDKKQEYIPKTSLPTSNKRNRFKQNCLDG